jgi:hypothetical protein
MEGVGAAGHQHEGVGGGETLGEGGADAAAGAGDDHDGTGGRKRK